MFRKLPLSAALAAGLIALAGCARQATEPPSPLQATATIQEIMAALVDPAADSLWESVSTEVTQAGPVDKVPRSDEEWNAVRHNAITLIESANLLLMDGRRVAAPGKALEDAKMPGNLSAEEAQKAIEGDRPTYVARAQELRNAAARALAAIDGRDVPALIEAGGRIDNACEHCHLKYWYPNGGAPKVNVAAGSGK